MTLVKITMARNITMSNPNVIKKAVLYKHGPEQKIFSVITSPSINFWQDSFWQNRVWTILVPFPQPAEHPDSWIISKKEKENMVKLEEPFGFILKIRVFDIIELWKKRC